MDPDITWSNGTGCPLVVHYRTDLQSLYGFRCYDNIAPNAKCQRVLVLAQCLVVISLRLVSATGLINCLDKLSLLYILKAYQLKLHCHLMRVSTFHFWMCLITKKTVCTTCVIFNKHALYETFGSDCCLSTTTLLTYFCCTYAAVLNLSVSSIANKHVL